MLNICSNGDIVVQADEAVLMQYKQNGAGFSDMFNYFLSTLYKAMITVINTSENQTRVYSSVTNRAYNITDDNIYDFSNLKKVRLKASRA